MLEPRMLCPGPCLFRRRLVHSLGRMTATIGDTCATRSMRRSTMTVTWGGTSVHRHSDTATMSTEIASHVAELEVCDV